jgi:hypothetical protein
LNLVVGGCSFSSNFNLDADICWPVFLSKQLNCSVINESRVQGSNWRIWRTITNHILQGTVNNKDTVVIQYTELHRQEVWSPIAPHVLDKTVEEPYDGGKLFKFKFGSHMYGKGLEKPLSQMLLRCSNEKYEVDRFTVHHNMFCGFLESKGFKKVYFLDTTYGPFNDPSVHKSSYPIINGRHLLEHHLPDDPWHLSELGHRRAANLVLNFIKT